MKNKILFLSSALCICAIPAFASDCVGPNCDAPDVQYEFNAEYVDTDTVPKYIQNETINVDYGASNVEPMRNVKLLSIKPAPIDNRPPIWDGTTGKYTQRLQPKTVSQKNGIPIWDDSISDYNAKDFRDWMLEPLPEVYFRYTDDELTGLYEDTMSDAADTRARIEELLGANRPCSDAAPTPACMPAPVCNDAYPAAACNGQYSSNGAYGASGTVYALNTDYKSTDGCPFETETECNIWRRKPIIREIVAPRSPKIRDDKMMQFLSDVNCNGVAVGGTAASAPLVERYKMLMKAARACCTEGMAYSLRRAGASNGLIYKFMSDDANFYNIGNRCLMMSDAELDSQYGDSATASVVADVRNGCLCRGREWFSAMLAPFVDAWNASPEFKSSSFMWTYRDGLNREVTVSINEDVENVLNQLAECP
ncbi:MAG: hypothetical protein J6T57_03835 [Alphaproteobacteria bacterium]|nr:hypothetical protein [Alphaproteobacteria bacterium]